MAVNRRQQDDWFSGSSTFLAESHALPVILRRCGLLETDGEIRLNGVRDAIRLTNAA